jgi:multicomponent Na+:H+ antiporter subunit B
MKNKEPGMTIIVKTITRLTIGLIFIYGIYISLHGHTKPGGGFAGGVIIALSFINILLAFGKKVALNKLGQAAALSLMGFLAMAFLLMLTLGVTAGHRGILSQLTSLCDITISLVMGSGIFAIFLALARIDKEED